MLFSSIGFAQSIEKNDMNQEENMENLSVYPNPVSHGKLYVVTKNNFTKHVEIYNVLGKKILSETLSGKELNISKIKPGIYIIKITENNISATRKLIVK
ncbi:T9SS type A sorting domain-containing protein [Bizionia algoritergicola]|uniref:T9SS type A sorting domain-containing protein n=2 Tax=Flavobacteriaceae TaxID=49546 RepID=A0A5D0R483_9FLAO|nr:T9SS type A sorting domain-containing protein [Bizionia algoritergicola]